jgi:hypothetical protein
MADDLPAGKVPVHHDKLARFDRDKPVRTSCSRGFSDEVLSYITRRWPRDPGLAGAQQVMGSVIRSIIGRMDGPRLPSMSASIRQLMPCVPYHRGFAAGLPL